MSCCGPWVGPRGSGTPLGTKMGPKRDAGRRGGSKVDPWASRAGPPASKGPQGCPKGVPRGDRQNPTGAQGSPKGAQRSPKGSPKGPKGPFLHSFVVPVPSRTSLLFIVNHIVPSSRGDLVDQNGAKGGTKGPKERNKRDDRTKSKSKSKGKRTRQEQSHPNSL